MNINNLISALDTLKLGYEKYLENKNVNVKDMLADSCVKRFEYTMETSIKIMKKFLKEIYFTDERDLTVNNIFRLMAGYEIIGSWESWRDYYQKRNNTAHEYNIEKARDLVTLIPQFIKDCSILVTNLQNILENPKNG